MLSLINCRPRIPASLENCSDNSHRPAVSGSRSEMPELCSYNDTWHDIPSQFRASTRSSKTQRWQQVDRIIHRSSVLESGSRLSDIFPLIYQDYRVLRAKESTDCAAVAVHFLERQIVNNYTP